MSPKDSAGSYFRLQLAMLHTASRLSTSLCWCVVKAIFLTTFLHNSSKSSKELQCTSYLVLLSENYLITEPLLFPPISHQMDFACRSLVIAAYIHRRNGLPGWLFTCNLNIILALTTISITPCNGQAFFLIWFHYQT